MFQNLASNRTMPTIAPSSLDRTIAPPVDRTGTLSPARTSAAKRPRRTAGPQGGPTLPTPACVRSLLPPCVLRACVRLSFAPRRSMRDPQSCEATAGRARQPLPVAALPGTDPGTPAPSAARKSPGTPWDTPQAAPGKRAPRRAATGRTLRLLGQHTGLLGPQQLSGARRVNQALQTLRLSASHPATEIRYPVVAAALVVELGVGALVGLLYQPLGEHALDRTVERPRPETHLAPGPILDLLHDPVPVPLLIRQRQQDVQHRRRQR